MAGSKRTLWLILGLCLGVPLLGVALFGMLVGFDIDTQPGDRERVFTVEDLGEPPEGGRETLTRTRYIDWTGAVEYEYEDDNGLYIYCLHTEEHTVRDARNVFLGQSASSSLMASVSEEGVELVDQPALFSWGDQHRAHVITVNGVEAGYSVQVRRDNHVFSLAITGVVFDDGVLEALVVPALERATNPD